MNSEQEYYVSLVERLRQMPEETEWLEYKVNNCEPELIGEYISALSHSATICNKEKAYLLLDNYRGRVSCRGYLPSKLVVDFLAQLNQECEEKNNM